jgi:hypothetical protein
MPKPLKTAADGAGAEAQLMPQVDPALYLVVITDLPNLAAAEKKAAELKRFGVVATGNRGARRRTPGNRARAPSHRRGGARFPAGLNKRGIKSARVDARDQPPVKARVELRGPAASLLQQLPRLIAPMPMPAVTDCPR